MSAEVTKSFRVTAKTHQNGRVLANYLDVDMWQMVDRAIELLAQQHNIELPNRPEHGMVVKDGGQ